MEFLDNDSIMTRVNSNSTVGISTTARGRDLLKAFSLTTGMKMTTANEAIAAYAMRHTREVLQFWVDECGGAAAPAADHADSSASAAS